MVKSMPADPALRLAFGPSRTKLWAGLLIAGFFGAAGCGTTASAPADTHAGDQPGPADAKSETRVGLPKQPAPAKPSDGPGLATPAIKHFAVKGPKDPSERNLIKWTDVNDPGLHFEMDPVDGGYTLRASETQPSGRIEVSDRGVEFRSTSAEVLGRAEPSEKGFIV